MAVTTTIFCPSLTTPISVPTTWNNHIHIPPEPIFNNLNLEIGSLQSCGNLQEIKQIHGQFTKQGLIRDSAILTNVITKYSQIGSSESLEYALKAFKIFKDDEENGSRSITYLYNSLIKGYSSAGLFHEAIFLYVDMLVEGIGPDNYTFPFVLTAFAKSFRLSEGVQLHGSVVKMGFHDDVYVLNSLINCYGGCGEIDKARQVFDEMCGRNVVSWTSLICGYARRDRHEEAVSLFFEMVEQGIEPNEVTIVSAVSACAKLRRLDLGERILDYVGRSRLKINSLVVNAVVDMYMKCGAAARARHLFDGRPDRDLGIFNTLMSNYEKLGKVKEALDIFSEMLDFGLKPDRVTMLSVITSAAELGDSSLGMECHAYVLRNGFESSDSIGNSIIDMYTKSGRQESASRVFDQMSNKTVVSWNSLLAGFARNGDVELAQGLFNEMPEKDVVSWNTMIGALVQHSSFNEAIELFHSMQKEGIMADEATMVSVASACGYLGALDLAKWTYNYIEKSGIQCNMRLSTALIDMFAKCGDPQSGMKVFTAMNKKDVSAWTAAIGAMAVEGNGERALELFHKMLRQGIVPDEIVFSVVLTACSHAGLVEEGMRIFNSIREYRIKPHMIHYGCVVDLLGRAGLLEEALDFIYNMPMEPNGAIWSAFLAACRTHKNEKMATRAAKMIDKSADDKTGIQILLSNIYAFAGKWDDVAKVRMNMKEKGMKKTPGSSSIEVNGVIHEFTSGDESHPETASMLQEMICRLRSLGYAPDLTNVLLDVDEQEKEFLLSRHSEKIAIAFGLLSSSQGMPVRIVKNLRMCSDCHSFAKMVSKLYDREIVIRDNNRFHFFRQGLCSCRDYW